VSTAGSVGPRVVLALLLAVVAASCGQTHRPEPGATAGSTPRSAPPRPGAPVESGKTCDRFASTTGSDNAPGTAARPFGTVARLLASLRRGQTGCLRSGIYDEDVTVSRGGAPGRPITVTSAPGEHATVRGIVWVADSANDVVLSDLSLQARASGREPSVQVNGDRVVLAGDDITNHHTGICVILGGEFVQYGVAVDPVVERSRIHDCGRLPRTNLDHGIYVEGTRGARIVDNVIVRNADWGVQLYPDAQGTVVAGNVIAGNGGGVILAGGRERGRDFASSGNVIERNVIAASQATSDLATSWKALVGRGNAARFNCLSGAMQIDAPDGTALQANITADPAFADAAGGDYRLRPTSGCRKVTTGPGG
jgi:parallel beta-helix repeat protein